MESDHKHPACLYACRHSGADGPTIDFIKPLTPETQKTSLEFFNIVNFVLQFCPADPSETELMTRFARIGVGAGKTFDPNNLTPEMKTAFEQGRADAYAAFAGGVKQLDDGTLTSGDLFGTREAMKNNYLYRWLGTIGIYGNSKQEAMYPIYRIDAEGQKLSGASRYTVRFAPGQLPPVNAFWSLLRACLGRNVACGITATTAQGIARRLGEGWKMIRTTNGALNQWRASQSGR
jgi:hypothetical protein